MPLILRIDSRDKDESSRSNTDFTVDTLPLHATNVRVKQVIIPNIFNNIRNSPPADANSLFHMEVAGSPLDAILPNGLYTVDQLTTYLGGVLTGIDLTLDPITGHITLLNNSGGTIKIFNTDDGNPMGVILGITVTEEITAGGSITFGNKPNLFNYSMLYVVSSKLSNAYNMISSRDNQRLPVIATVPIDVGYGANVVYEPNEIHDVEFESKTNIENIDMKLVNHAGEVVPMDSNHHWQVLCEIR